MARILIGWELGANQGHISRILQFARPLQAAGHVVALALQDNSHIAPERLADFAMFQAPVWPRLLASQAMRNRSATVTMGDILFRLGLDRAETMPALVAGWHSIFAAFQPDVAVGDFAPALGVAAMGRVPLVAVGTGFSIPPPDAPRFPVLIGDRPAHDEEAMLEATDRALALAGFERLGALPRMFGGDRVLVQTLQVLDPYRGVAGRRYGAPAMAAPRPEIVDGGGDEVFVYGFERAMGASMLWQGLKASGLKVRVHVPRLSAGAATQLSGMGFIVEPDPLPFSAIGARSRLVLSHGGHGFVTSALLAGLPQIVTHYDLEKQKIGEAVAAGGLGGHSRLTAIKPELFGESLRQYHARADAHAAVRDAAHGFQDEAGRVGMVAETIAAVEELIAA